MKTFADLDFKAHPTMNGYQAKIFFNNGYGISVVRFTMPYGGYGSYTSSESEWEAAVLHGTPEDWSISYNTPITDDVLGHLTENEVTEIMIKVQQLEP